MSLHVHDVLSHRGHVELKRGQLSLVIRQIGLQHAVTGSTEFHLKSQVCIYHILENKMHNKNRQTLQTLRGSQAQHTPIWHKSKDTILSQCGFVPCFIL